MQNQKLQNLNKGKSLVLILHLYSLPLHLTTHPHTPETTATQFLCFLSKFCFVYVNIHMCTFLLFLCTYMGVSHMPQPPTPLPVLSSWKYFHLWIHSYHSLTLSCVMLHYKELTVRVIPYCWIFEFFPIL